MNKPAETVSASRSDSELLTEFMARRDEPAFAEIVRRHGGMVVATCRSLLGNTQDAEDAAQAVFLTLAQRASSLKNRTTLVGWLYRVAWYVAARAGEAKAIRRRHEQEAARMKPNATMSDDKAIPLEMLHAALADLPEKYRLPLLLYHLEGRSEQETASLVGCSRSATSVRLTRGRQLLRTRLAKRGVAASAVGLVAVLATQASAGVTPTFVTSASQVAVAVLAGKTATAVASASVTAFSKVAMNMLFWAKMKLAAMVMAAILLVGGTGVATYVVAAGNPASSSTPAPVPTGAATQAASIAVEEPTVFMWELVHAKVVDGQLTLVPAQEEPVSIGNLMSSPGASPSAVNMNVPGNVYVRAGGEDRRVYVMRSLKEGKKDHAQAADLQGTQFRLTEGLKDMETTAMERVSYIDVLTPGPARVTLMVSKTDKESPGVKADIKILVKLEAASFGEMCAKHPEEVAKYIEPILRDLDLEGVFFVDPKDARHALAAQLPQDPAAVAKLKALLPKLDDDSPEVRQAAELELKGLGDAGVAPVKAIDLSKQPRQTRLTLGIFLASVGAKSEDARLSNPDFLLLCMALEDKQIAGMAKAQLEKLRGKAVEVDLAAPAEERCKVVRKMLIEGWANAKGAETRK